MDIVRFDGVPNRKRLIEASFREYLRAEKINDKPGLHSVAVGVHVRDYKRSVGFHETELWTEIEPSELEDMIQKMTTITMTGVWERISWKTGLNGTCFIRPWVELIVVIDGVVRKHQEPQAEEDQREAA